jgi:hypothetical protein
VKERKTSGVCERAADKEMSGVMPRTGRAWFRDDVRGKAKSVD